MRTTLSLDDDVLAAARALAARDSKTVGEVISALSRQALQPRTSRRVVRNGVPLLQAPPGGGSLVTPDMVNRLRDELP